MSSTNRGRDRNKYDYYITPQIEIKKFFEIFKNYYINEDSLILDPCAGGDINHEMSYPSVLKEYGYKVDTLDIREDSRAEIIADYLNYEVTKKYDIIITNPPFNLSMDFLKKALDDVEDGGYVIMLLRLNFYGSKKRNDWLLNNMPFQCYVHSKRISFTLDGKTDSIEYAHFVWKKGENNKSTELILLHY